MKKQLRIELAAQFKRCQFCFELNTFMAIEDDIVFNQTFCRGKILDFLTVDALILSCNLSPTNI